MSTHTIKRTMYTGNDFDSGELEFVLKVEHPDGTVLTPFAPELEYMAKNAETFNTWALFGAMLGNALSNAPFDEFAYRIAKHTVLWSDELSITVPDHLE